MRAANPVVVRMMGANINRPTRANLERAGFTVESETDLWLDVVKLFVVAPGPSVPQSHGHREEPEVEGYEDGDEGEERPHAQAG